MPLDDGLGFGGYPQPPDVPPDPDSDDWRGPPGPPGPAGPPGQDGVPEAPIDGATYGRRNAGWQGVLPLIGGTMLGALVLAANPATALQAAPKQYVDLMLPKAGGTMAGALILAADPATALGAATKQYVDAVSTNLTTNYLPLTAGPTKALTDGLHSELNGNVPGHRIRNIGGWPSINMDAGSGTTNVCGLIDGRRGNLPRWQMFLGNAATESGSNAGSDFSLIGCSDAGAQIVSLSMVRATGALTLSATTGSSTTFEVDNTNGPANVVLSSGTTGVIAASITGRRGSLNRWSMELGSATAESGSDAGSNFALRSWTDAGALLHTPLSIVRSTGMVTLGRGLTITNSTAGISFSGTAGASNSDLSKGIALNSTTYGFGYTANRVNYNVPTGATHVFLVNAVDIATVASTGISITGGLSTSTAINSTTNVNATAALTAGTFVLAGTNSVAGSMTINGPAASTRQFRWNTAGLARWSIGSSVDAEAGADAGGNLAINRFADAGTVIETALLLVRATGSAIVTKGLGMFNTTPPTSKPAVTGSRGGNAALASLLTTLATFGIITDSSTA